MQRRSLIHARAPLGAALLATVAAMACGAFKGSDANAPPDGGGADGGAGNGQDGDTLVIGGDVDGGRADSGHCSLMSAGVRLCDDFDTHDRPADFWTIAKVTPDKLAGLSPQTAVVASTDVNGQMAVMEELLSVPFAGPKGVYSVDFDFRVTNATDGCTIFRLVDGTNIAATLDISSSAITLNANGKVASLLSPTTAGTPTKWAHAHLDVLFGNDGGIGATVNDVLIAYKNVVVATQPPNVLKLPLVQFGAIANPTDCGVYFDNIDVRAQ